MKRRASLAVLGIIIFLVTAYLAYHHGLSGRDLSEFLEAYFGSLQKYLFLMTIFGALILLCLARPVFEPMVFVRLKGSLYVYLLRCGMIYSLCGTILILGSFFVSGIVLGLEAHGDIGLLAVPIRLFLFVLVFYCLCMAMYLRSGKLTFSVMLVMLSNFLLIALLYGVDFFVLNNTMGEHVEALFLEAYLMAGLALGMAYLYWKAGRVECLMLEERAF